MTTADQTVTGSQLTVRRCGLRPHAPHPRDAAAEPRSSTGQPCHRPRPAHTPPGPLTPDTTVRPPPLALGQTEPAIHLLASTKAPWSGHARDGGARRALGGGAAPVVRGEAGCRGHGALSPPWALRRVDSAGPPGSGRQGEGPGLVVLSVHTDAPSACDPSAYTADWSPSPPPTALPTDGEMEGWARPPTNSPQGVTVRLTLVRPSAPALPVGRQGRGGARCQARGDTHARPRLSPGRATWLPSRCRLCSDWPAAFSCPGCSQRASGSRGALLACARGDRERGQSLSLGGPPQECRWGRSMRG